MTVECYHCNNDAGIVTKCDYCDEYICSVCGYDTCIYCQTTTCKFCQINGKCRQCNQALDKK